MILQWGIMAILASLIVVRLTYLPDSQWLWVNIFTGVLGVFSLPFLVSKMVVVMMVMMIRMMIRI